MQGFKIGNVKYSGIAFDLSFTYVQVSGIFYSSETILAPYSIVLVISKRKFL